jgi:hypothetical protein
MSQFFKDAAKPAATVAGVVVVVGLVWLMFGSRIKRAAAAAAEAVNPVSDQNLAYRGVNAVGAAISGRDSFSLGSWIYDLVHDDEHIASNPPRKTEEEKSFWGQLNPFD